ncbi:hypothetical protein EG68_10737 [Paragonimus skrjabini miyazakii]|uniref:EGF-like domain-containing protein n=1 Tax=Paragonimus skrjabini miyazakii TaxID=59628 RepID=A0A8S9YKI5_9TREM|nr:hypothetical protein EG68_10737 [Paragonimus skrjabini miyazakii]
MSRIHQLAYHWLFVFGFLLCGLSIVCCVPNGIFCNDLTPTSLSLEALAVDLPLLGSKWDTVEQLTESSTLQANVGVRSCNGNTYCNPNGTLFCREDVGNARTQCTCKPQFQGLRCNEQVDACKQRIEHPYLPNGGHIIAGARACNINHDGNTCHQWITVDGDPAYRCVCGSQQWSPDPALPYDNCLKRHSMCAGVICVHGQCVSSFTGKLVSLEAVQLDFNFMTRDLFRLRLGASRNYLK